MISESTIRGAIETSDDSIVVQLTTVVIAQFEKLTGRRFTYAENHTELLITKGRNTVLFLTHRPVIEVTKVEQRGRYDSTWTELSDALYAVDDARIEMLAGYFAVNTRVTYTFGYVNGAGVGEIETPADIIQALITQAKFMLARLGGSLIAQKQTSIGKAAGSLEDANYHPLFVATAERYRHG